MMVETRLLARSMSKASAQHLDEKSESLLASNVCRRGHSIVVESLQTQGINVRFGRANAEGRATRGNKTTESKVWFDHG
jgi:hypothetical protein